MTALVFIQFVILLLKNEVHIAGALLGGICGIASGLVWLRRSRCLARQGIFVDTPTRRDRRVSFVIFLLVIVSGILIPQVRDQFRPSVNSKERIITAVSFFAFFWCGIEMLGIYFMERHYKEKFYMGKRPRA
jgi:hypothetical protein